MYIYENTHMIVYIEVIKWPFQGFQRRRRRRAEKIKCTKMAKRKQVNCRTKLRYSRLAHVFIIQMLRTSQLKCELHSDSEKAHLCAVAVVGQQTIWHLLASDNSIISRHSARLCIHFM